MENQPNRIPITLNDEQWNILYSAATDPLGLHATMDVNLKTGITITETPSRQQLVNAAWAKIAPDFGIDPASAKLDPDRGPRAFTAILLTAQS